MLAMKRMGLLRIGVCLLVAAAASGCKRRLRMAIHLRRTRQHPIQPRQAINSRAVPLLKTGPAREALCRHLVMIQVVTIQGAERRIKAPVHASTAEGLPAECVKLH